MHSHNNPQVTLRWLCLGIVAVSLLVACQPTAEEAPAAPAGDEEAQVVCVFSCRRENDTVNPVLVQHLQVLQFLLGYVAPVAEDHTVAISQCDVLHRLCNNGVERAQHIAYDYTDGVRPLSSEVPRNRIYPVVGLFDSLEDLLSCHFPDERLAVDNPRDRCRGDTGTPGNLCYVHSVIHPRRCNRLQFLTSYH